MSENPKNPINQLPTGTPSPIIDKQTEGPILLEIKAAVEKLAGDVKSLTERMNKQGDKKPEDKYPPPCGKSVEDIAAETEKAKKPPELVPPKEKKQDPAAPSAPADHGCSPDEEWDEASQSCVAKPKGDKKPEPYPAEPKKSLDIINAQMAAINKDNADLKEQVTMLTKSLGIPAFKRTEVIRKEDMDAPIDVAHMSYSQLHELARAVDLGRSR